MRKSLSAKIYSLIAVLGILCVALCLTVNVSMSNIKKLTSTAANGYFPVVKTIGEMNYDIMNLRLTLNLYAYTDGTWADNLKSVINAEENTITAQAKELGGYVENLNDATLSSSVKQFEKNFASLKTVATKIMSLADAGNFVEAQAAVVESYTYFTDNEEIMNNLTAFSEKGFEESSASSISKITGASTFTMVSFIAFLILVVVVILIVRVSVVLPLQLGSKEMGMMINEIEKRDGDLTKRINTKSADDVGRLFGDINRFVEVLQKIMIEIRSGSNELKEAVAKSVEGVKNSNGNATSISAALQELAASMEEITATASQLVTDSENVLKETNSMNEKAGEGVSLVDEIKERAVQINREIKENKKTTEGMVTTIGSALNEAVEGSKSVSKINELTDQILDISSQTNLLALNASIEAARAGEAGKGFAVVADEIRMLADSSRETANNIQDISKNVIEAVSKLTENAQQMINFVDSDVMKDYENFVEFAQKYHDDAENMNEIFHGFASGSESMTKVMDNMVQSISAIATTVDESALGVTNAAENSGGLVAELTNISGEIDVNSKIAGKLSEEVNRFKKL